LLHASQDETQRRAGDVSSKFDVSSENFPYLSYPMVSAPLPSEDESFQEKGRLLRRLRQNAKYLAPGNGINTLSLAGVFVRNLVASVVVHVAVLVVVLQLLIGSGLLTLERPSNALLMLSLAAFGGYGLASAVYVLLTGFFDPIEKRWSDGPYRLRRWHDIFTAFVLTLAIAALIIGALPWVHGLIRDLNLDSLPGWLDLFEHDKAKNRSVLVGALATLFGLLGNVWAFLQTRSSKKPRIPTNLVLTVACAVLALGVLLLVFLLTVQLNSLTGEGEPRNTVLIVGFALLPMFLLGWLPDVNYVSLHRFYRDRLMELFLPDLQAMEKGEGIAASTAGDAAMLGELCGAGEKPKAKAASASAAQAAQKQHALLPGPYHILNANVVLVASKHPRYRARGGDNFILSPLFCGSRATGWTDTDHSADNGFTLATAMAVSGAALNPNAGPGGVGVTRQPLLSVLMGLLNLRLGYWCPNPNPYCKSSSLLFRLFARRATPNLLSPGLFESLGRANLNEHEPYVLLTDGGHFENLGLYELVRRRLKLIVLCDATADADFKFVDLANAIEKVRADFGAIVHLSSDDLGALVPRQRSSIDTAMTVAQRGYLIAPITYARREDRSYGCEADRGILIYLKATFFKQLNADLHGYRRAHADFPDQSTGDQYFDEKQFESYRELGFQTCWAMLQDLQAHVDAEHGTLRQQAAGLLWTVR
jgi:hypothetical protein